MKEEKNALEHQETLQDAPKEERTDEKPSEVEKAKEEPKQDESVVKLINDLKETYNKKIGDLTATYEKRLLERDQIIKGFINGDNERQEISLADKINESRKQRLKKW